jgi:hypothetical protein
VALFFGASHCIVSIVLDYKRKKEILSIVTGSGSKEPRRKIFGAILIF